MAERCKVSDQLGNAAAVVGRLQRAIDELQRMEIADNPGWVIVQMKVRVPTDCANDVKSAVVGILQGRLDAAQVVLRAAAEAYVKQY